MKLSYRVYQSYRIDRKLWCQCMRVTVRKQWKITDNRKTRAVDKGRSFGQFMVTRVRKIYQKNGSEQDCPLRLDNYANLRNIMWPTNKSTFKLVTTEQIFSLRCISTNSKVWESLAIKSSLLTGTKQKPSYRLKSHFEYFYLFLICFTDGVQIME